ncbi:MAG: RQC-minor-1 family DNA-binding protein [Acidobacteriota bacterium]
MSRRNVNRVPVHLDSGGIAELPMDDIRAILRGADTMISSGGRTLLSKLLKGSRDKKILELGLDRCPVHGYYSKLPLQEILKRIDWTIQQKYLRIAYEWRLPTLVFTDRGWAIEIETMTDELLESFDHRQAHGPPFEMSDLKDRNRGMILLLLDKIENSGRSDFIPLLRAWAAIDYKMIRERIGAVTRSLQETSEASGATTPDEPLSRS